MQFSLPPQHPLATCSSGVTELLHEATTAVPCRREWRGVGGQFADVLALMGDASDNVPGVKGIGSKGAVTLLQQYGDIETLLANADQVVFRREHRSASDDCWMEQSDSQQRE